jgi:hypothetical protein
MKNLVRLACTTVLAISAGTATVTALPTAATAREQPYATLIFVRGGQAVGSMDAYCTGDPVFSGDTTNYDYAVWNYYYECP